MLNRKQEPGLWLGFKQHAGYFRPDLQWKRQMSPPPMGESIYFGGLLSPTWPWLHLRWLCTEMYKVQSTLITSNFCRVWQGGGGENKLWCTCSVAPSPNSSGCMSQTLFAINFCFEVLKNQHLEFLTGNCEKKELNLILCIYIHQIK